MGTGKLLGRPDDMLWGNPGRNSFPRRGKGGGGGVGSSDTPSLFMQRHNLQLD